MYTLSIRMSYPQRVSIKNLTCRPRMDIIKKKAQSIKRVGIVIINDHAAVLYYDILLYRINARCLILLFMNFFFNIFNRCETKKVNLD